MHIVRSVMMCDDWQINDLRRPLRYFISWRYVRQKFVYCVRAFAVAVRARGNVTLYADNVYIHYVDQHIRFVPPSRPQYTLRRESQQRSNAIGLAKIYSVCTSNLTSHCVVVCAERNRVFSIIIVIGIIVVDVIVSMHYVSGFKRVFAISTFP